MSDRLTPGLAALCPGAEDLREFLSEDAGLGLLRELGLKATSCDVTYVRLKPGQSTTLGLCITVESEPLGAEPSKALAYVSLVGSERGPTVYEKARAMQPVDSLGGRGVRLLSSKAGVLWLFPNDRHLRDLRWVVDMSKLKRTLSALRPKVSNSDSNWRIRGRRSSLTTVRYKPERRFIAKVDVVWRDDATGHDDQQNLFLRYFNDERGTHLQRVSEALASTSLRPHLPRGLGAFMNGRLHVEEAICGLPLQQLFMKGQWNDGPALAELVHKLHSSRVSLPEAEQPATSLARAMEALALPAALSEIVRVRLSALERSVQGLQWPKAWIAPIHGDLHLQQILSTGGSLYLVDLERVALGDPRQDLGLLRAQLLVLAADDEDLAARSSKLWESFWFSLVRLRSDLRQADLEPFIVLGLLELAQMPFRRVTAGWDSSLAQVLDLCIDALGCELSSVANERESAQGSAFEALQPLPFARERIHVFYPKIGKPWPAICVMDGKKAFGIWHPNRREFEEVGLESDPILHGCLPLKNGAKVVSRRPRSRAVIRERRNAQDVYIKVASPRKSQKSRTELLKAQAIQARMGHPALAVPELLEDHSGQGRLVLGALPGDTLHQLLGGAEELLPVLQRLGAGLAAWHSASTEELNLNAPMIDADLVGLFSTVAHLLKASEVEGLSALVAAVPPSPAFQGTHPIHGDLHDKNIMISDEGIGMLDFDGLRMGCREQDVGNLLAHLILRGHQFGRQAESASWESSVRNGYATGGVALDAVTLADWRARTLVRLVMLYHLRASGREIIQDLKQEAWGAVRQCRDHEL